MLKLGEQTQKTIYGNKKALCIAITKRQIRAVGKKLTF